MVVSPHLHNGRLQQRPNDSERCLLVVLAGQRHTVEFLSPIDYCTYNTRQRSGSLYSLSTEMFPRLYDLPIFLVLVVLVSTEVAVLSLLSIYAHTR